MLTRAYKYNLLIGINKCLFCFFLLDGWFLCGWGEGGQVFMCKYV